MSSRLSAWKYVKNNKATVAVLVTALAISFMAMYVVYVLLITTTESFETIMVKMPQRLSYINLGAKAYGLNPDDFDNNDELNAAFEEKREELVNKLKNTKGIEDAFYTQIITSRYQAVMGEFNFEMPLMEADQVQGFLNHMDASITDGKMPKEPGDVLVDETIMKNAGYKIGDWYMEKWFGQTFRITGTMKSDYMVSVGVPNGYTNSGWYIVVYNDENTTDMVGILEDNGITISDEDEVLDAAEYLRNYKELCTDTIDAVISTIFTIIMTFLAILVLVAYVSFLRNRINEYCLYSSIGYSRGDIYKMIVREMLILFGAGTLAGLIISIGCAFIINISIIRPKGLVGHVVYMDQIFSIITTYVFIIGVLQIPVLLSLKKIRTIDAIEE